MTVGLAAMRGFHPQATTGAVAGAIDALVAAFSKHMNDMYVKVDASQDHWKGSAATAANQRSLGERIAGNTLIGELDDIAQAYRKHGSAMDGYCTAAVTAADDYLRQGFTVADDGTVTVPPGKKDVPGAVPGQTIPMSAEQLATYAVEASNRVKGLVNQFNTEDLALAQAAGQELLDMVQKAAGEVGLGSWTMDTIDSGSTGVQDGLLVADKNATPEQMRLIADRLAEAGLTAQNIADINSGKHVELTEAHFAYLHSFYNTAGKDGLVSMTEQMSAGGDTVHAASVVNGLNTLANPNVGATGIGPTGNPMPLQGGLNQIPTGLTNVLTRDYAVQDGNRTKHSNINGGELREVTSMLALGDKMSAPGSEINTKLFEQAGALTEHSGHQVSGEREPDGLVSNLVQNMVEVAGEDKIAVTEVMVDEGKRENIFGQLLTNEYNRDDGAAVGNMLSWIEGDATSADPAVSDRAGSAASGLADYVTKHKDELLNLNGPNSESIGEVNPRATQGIASALSPYIADIAGVDDQKTTTRNFYWKDDESYTKALSIFTVMDTDKDAATYFNAQAFMATSDLQQSWVNSVVENPGEANGELASRAGVIRGLIDQGLTAEAEERGKDAKVDGAGGFATKGEAYDGIKSTLNTGMKYIPFVKDVWVPAYDAYNTVAKNSIVGVYLPPDTPATTVSYGTYDASRQNYQIAQALQSHGLLDHSPTYGYMFNDNGALKSYDELLAVKGGDAHTINGNLTNVLNNHRGGIFQDQMQNYHIQYGQGLGSVK
ncbi:TPR repeat region-containing protein [Nocardia sp. IBHARD005]|uniref:TPR repeat region-containing protein n=1 Tax=Nocardia sp. IBHARD005 TaxID=3457765 RepID=UPI00405820F8